MAPCQRDDECGAASLHQPSTSATPEARSFETTASEGGPLDALAPVADLLFGAEENHSETTEPPVEYVPPADPPSAAIQ